MTHITFWAAGFGRRRVKLLYARIRIKLYVVIRIRFVTRSVCPGKFSGEISRMVPGVVLVSSAATSDRTVSSGELGVTGLLQSLLKIDFSYSRSHYLAYKSFIMITSGSGFHSRGVICISGIGWRVVTWDILIRRALAFYWCQFCVLNNSSSVTPFQ